MSNFIENGRTDVLVSEYLNIPENLREFLRYAAIRYKLNVVSAISQAALRPNLSVAYILQPVMSSTQKLSTKEREIYNTLSKSKYLDRYNVVDARTTLMELFETTLSEVQASIGMAGLKNAHTFSFRRIFDDKEATTTYFCDHGGHYTYEGYSSIVDSFKREVLPWILKNAKNAL